MAPRNIIVEMGYTRELASMATGAQMDPSFRLDTSAVPDVDGVSFDLEFPPTPLPGRESLERAESIFALNPYNLNFEPDISTYIVRAAEVEEAQIENLRRASNVQGVYSDVETEPTIVCPGDPAVGSDADVERLLCAAAMRSAGMDGLGVLVAIVDTGINMAYLNSRGKTPNFDAARSWVPRAGLTPGALPVSHGTMCAYDACIAAPNCTLLDIALLQSTARFSGLLSDAVRAYSHLLNIMRAPRRPGDSGALVVNNSWGMFHPSWDFPVGDPGNYSDNPNHPFNRIVSDLERAGADILFAAGNCGANCPDGRCQGVTNSAIYGANSHPSVLCVAGVDTTETRVGYSSIGPGRLTTSKPDVSGYTHFRGSGVYSADGGTSAATPVVAGVVAAVRSRQPYDPGNPGTHPAAIRSLVTSTAKDLGTAGYDLQHGFGVVSGCELHRRLAPRPQTIDICERLPWLCRPNPIIDICRRFPELCLDLPRPIPIPPDSGPGPGPLAETYDPALGETTVASEQIPELAEIGYAIGYRDGLRAQ